MSRNRKKKLSGRVSLDRGGNKLCVFCEEPSTDEELHGKLLTKVGMSAHYFCLLFSSGLCQNGKSEKQGLLGFLPEDIGGEIRRGVRLKCSYCKKIGATVGCVRGNCKVMYHFVCGRKNGVLFQFFDTFSSFCKNHRPQQKVPASREATNVCSICMGACVAAPGPDSLRAPCCRKDWYHRDCVQHHATSAGVHYFKCPLCNNKDLFQKEMLTYGIYIPDQDAAWETEPQAFQDLLERYRQCDAKVCRCVEGRKYDKEGSKWEIILCDFCGSQGSHVGCKFLLKDGQVDMCPDCKDIDNRMGGSLHHKIVKKTPVPERAAMPEMAVEMSPEKGKSSYPGPSGTLRKRGIPHSFLTSPDGRTQPLSPSWLSPPKSPSNATSTKKRARSAGENGKVGTKRQRNSDQNHTITTLECQSTAKVCSDNDFEDSLPLSKLAQTFNRNRLSGSNHVDGKKGRGKATKKGKSPGLDKTQTTLTGWLRLGSKVNQKSSTDAEVPAKNEIPNIFSKKSPAKRPSIIEWKGRQLLIRSPKVKLEKLNVAKETKKQQKQVSVYKPRKLDLKGDPARKRTWVPADQHEEGPVKVQTGPALLASLDCDFRVTRKMVSATEVVRCTYSDNKDETCVASPGPTSTSVKLESQSPVLCAAPSDTLAKRLRNSTRKCSNANQKVASNQDIMLTERNKVEHAVSHTAKSSDTNILSEELSIDSPSKNLRCSAKKVASPSLSSRKSITIEKTNTLGMEVRGISSPLRFSEPEHVSQGAAESMYTAKSPSKKSPRKGKATPQKVVTDTVSAVVPHDDSPAKQVRHSANKLQPTSNESDNTRCLIPNMENDNGPLGKCITNSSSMGDGQNNVAANTTPNRGSSSTKTANIGEQLTPVSEAKTRDQIEEANAKRVVSFSSVARSAITTRSPTLRTRTKHTIDHILNSQEKIKKKLIDECPQQIATKSPKAKCVMPGDGFTAIKEAIKEAITTEQNTSGDGCSLTSQPVNADHSSKEKDASVTENLRGDSIRNRLLKYTTKNLTSKYIEAARITDNVVTTNLTEHGHTISQPGKSETFVSKTTNPVTPSKHVKYNGSMSPGSKIARLITYSMRRSPCSQKSASLSPSYMRALHKSDKLSSSPSEFNANSFQMTRGIENDHSHRNLPSQDCDQLVQHGGKRRLACNISPAKVASSPKLAPAHLLNPPELNAKIDTSPRKALNSDMLLMAEYYATTSPVKEKTDMTIDMDDIVDLPELMDGVSI